MAGNGKGFLAIGLGLVTGGLAFAAVGAIGAASLAPIAAGLAFSATAALVMGGAQDKPGDGTGNQPDELSINTATESTPIPVPFGRVRLGGNIVRYDKRTFKSKPIYAESADQQAAGGKGGALGGGGGNGETDQITGYEYRLSWDLAFCVGPVDRITGLLSQPGEKNLLASKPNKNGDTTVNVLNFDETTFRLNETISDYEDVPFEGSARFYSGAPNQSRFGSDDYDEPEDNHRHVCFIHFKDFRMGRSPAPRTTSLEVLRWPRPVDADGNPIAGFRFRGSMDSNASTWLDANPAAAMFEVLTNDIWGAGVSIDQIDVDSFVEASQFFADRNIGLSFVLSSQDRLSEVINFMRDHVQTLVIWNGEKVRLVVLMDLAGAYSPLVRVTRDQVSKPVFSRPTWPSTVNEIRINFVNRLKGHKTHTVIDQDLGSIQTIGRIQSRSLELPGYSTRGLASRQARRFLLEAAYPQASLKFGMNRLHAGMEPGAFIQFVWPDWTTGQAVTFWRILEIQDDQTDSGELELTCVEDTYAVPYEGAVEPFQEPDAAFEEASDVDEDDVSTGDDHSIEVTGDFGPARIYEPEGVVTNGARVALIAFQRRSGYIGYVAWNWQITGTGNTIGIPAAAAWGAFGTLDGAITSSSRVIDRTFTFDFLLEHADDALDILNAAAFIDDAGDHVSDLVSSALAYFVVGNEVMRIGWAEEISPGLIRFSGIVRGVLASSPSTHLDGAVGTFIATLDSGYYLDVSGIPVGEDITFTADQVTIRGNIVDDTQITFTGPASDQFSARSLAVPPPELSGVPVDVAGDWEAFFRARTTANGSAGTSGNWYGELAAIWPAMPAGYGFYVEGYSGAGGTGTLIASTSLQTEFLSLPGGMPAALGINVFTWESDTGRIRLEATPTGGVVSFRIYALQNAVRSLTYSVLEP